ncbi:MAG: hypothetical protein F6K65_07355 [Moorea sp. SIO3C2]|uniref:hypothetical protein n=1 Tax=Moorena sp. SIO4E2 TaxID=2607826 RepID=UPI0013BE4D7C|nr:hypothetical protein [Moorena sp. SIO4E2]NEP48649.1 hypothetical protein [Moorena sp. SIO3C2]NEQ11706.1 hypothetical protein [Moorena sp. SIO4E2]
MPTRSKSRVGKVNGSRILTRTKRFLPTLQAKNFLFIEQEKLPAPCSLLPIPYSLFPIPCSLLPPPCSLFPVPSSPMHNSTQN